LGKRKGLCYNDIDDNEIFKDKTAEKHLNAAADRINETLKKRRRKMAGSVPGKSGNRSSLFP
jgi:hypothetical protein